MLKGVHHIMQSIVIMCTEPKIDYFVIIIVTEPVVLELIH